MKPAAAVDVEISGGVATISLNRPHRLNAVVPALVEDLLTALHVVDRQDRRVHAVLLTGNGRAFCAGHDLREPVAEGESRERLERIQQVTRQLRALRQPVIAAVHGYAIGAGAEFALGCDLVVAAEDAVFAFPEAGLGLSVTGGASRLLTLLAGPAKAKELLLLGERIDAATAERIGLVNSVVPAAELLPTATRWAQSIAAKPAYSITLAKRAVDSGMDSTLDAALELEVSHALITATAPEAAASATRFAAGGKGTA